MNIHCRTVSASEIRERKNFSGADWWFDENGDLQVRIEPLGNLAREKALMIHEITEALAWHAQHGTDVSLVDEFDAKFEAEHPENHGLEAGDADGAPYSVHHTVATCAERALWGFLLQLDPVVGSWSSYDLELGSK
jgi:hypothetical protein